jgi:thiol-disulfide isomerase/thioredoxin
MININIGLINPSIPVRFFHDAQKRIEWLKAFQAELYLLQSNLQCFFIFQFINSQTQSMRLLLPILFTFFSIGVFAQQRNVLIEKYSATWCGYCPAAALDMDDYMDTSDNIIGISTHFNDVMEVPEGRTATNAYILSFPGSTIDRHKFDGEDMNVFYQDWLPLVQERLATPSPLNVNAVTSYNPVSRMLDITITVDVVSADQGDFRINCFILEDSVTGGSSYNQANYYFNNDPSHPLYGQGNPIFNYVHNHVLRKMTGGTWGTASIIPNQIGAGEQYTHSYSIALNSTWDENKIKVVSLVQKYDASIEQRDIVNAFQTKSISTAGMKDLSSNSKLRIFPNPTNGSLSIDFGHDLSPNASLKMYSASGVLVWKASSLTSNSGLYTIDCYFLDDNGFYFIEVLDDHKTERIKFAFKN